MSNKPSIPDQIRETAHAFQETDLGGMTLQGPIGYHIYYAWESEDLTTPLEAAIHMALNDVMEEVWVDEDEVERRHGEVTPETVARETTEQLDELCGLFQNPWTEEQFEEELANTLEQLSRHQPAEDGGDA